MSVIVVTGTCTGVGKTVATAAVASLAAARGASVAVVKPGQTGVPPGEDGDLAEIARLSGVTDLHEYARFPDPLSPAAAARRAGVAPVDLPAAVGRITGLAADHDLVLVEGAGGLLVRYDDEGNTVADLARWLGAPVLLVVRPDLGTLNHTALTLEAMAHRGLNLAGVVIGSWPDDPDLAMRSNLPDLEALAARPLAGALPSGAGALDTAGFLRAARRGLAPALGGSFDAAAFRAAHAPTKETP
ncbi:dethiobiotin synthase [Actinomadura harenae]|uniref:ATP-dependent dethiobiotin synthetase BioD n=1 Tax=Actinomadura harenae TaxID=2483351 RepID=A0A3M2LKH1_9ACTN|nr:dethiobiotin synthase [Actinomadura harenae]RMI37967.1 ATP-dependent dethiobiotin synthetase BioD [Actinomadura harenae]